MCALEHPKARLPAVESQNLLTLAAKRSVPSHGERTLKDQVVVGSSSLLVTFAQT